MYLISELSSAERIQEQGGQVDNSTLCIVKKPQTRLYVIVEIKLTSMPHIRYIQHR